MLHNIKIRRTTDGDEGLCPYHHRNESNLSDPFPKHHKNLPNLCQLFICKQFNRLRSRILGSHEESSQILEIHSGYYTLSSRAAVKWAM